MTINEAARLALEVQDASNLSGVVKAFDLVINCLNEQARMRNEGTDWKNRHPVAVLFASKIASLTGSDSTRNFRVAYDECSKLAAP
jgi:hypothetical protein